MKTLFLWKFLAFLKQLFGLLDHFLPNLCGFEKKKITRYINSKFFVANRSIVLKRNEVEHRVQLVHQVHRVEFLT